MTAETIEGMAVEVEPERGMVVQQPGQAMVASAARPAAMIAVAAALADALKNIIEKQHLYTDIRGKRYPQVEAWMTIGRLDNVVAREAERPIRNEDGSYEAFVELVRLSDGMVIGRASALCGMADDEPWGGTAARNGKSAQPPRAEYARRSMAVTRATSRAFRQQYAWVMALAGYEPTPADEMPDHNGETHQPRPLGAHDTPPDRPQLQRTTHADGLTGNASLGKDGGTSSGTDYQLRIEKSRGHVIGFRLTMGSKGYKVLAFGPLAEVLATQSIIGERVTCWGTMHDEDFNKDGKTITYQIMHLERIQTPDGILPMVEASGPPEQPEFDLEALDRELAS